MDEKERENLAALEKETFIVGKPEEGEKIPVLGDPE
jgi:hypothetical protein